jgi:hypothetical protein
MGSVKGIGMSNIKTLFFAAVFCTAAAGFGQTNTNAATVVATLAPQPPATKIEALLARKGKLIIRDVYAIAEFPSARGDRIRFAAIAVYEPNQEASKVKGMRIDVVDMHGNSQRLFFDLDEIAGLIKAAGYMSDNAVTWKGQIKESAEISYSTKSDFKFGFFQKVQQQTPFIATSSNSENCLLRSMDDLKLIADNAAKCVAKLNESPNP